MNKQFPPALIMAVSSAIEHGDQLEEVALRHSVTIAEASRWHRELKTMAARLATNDKTVLTNGIAEVITERSSQAFALLDNRGVCLYVNSAFINIFGFTKDELYAKPLHDLIHRRCADSTASSWHCCALINAFVAPASLSQLEDFFFDKDGTPVRVICEVSPIEDADGKDYAVLEVRDVTREAALLSSLSLHQKRLESLFSSNLLGVIYWSLDGDVEDANDEFLRIVKYTRDDLSNHKIDWRDMTPLAFRKGDAAAVEQLRLTGSHPTIEKQYKCKDGSLVWVAVTSAMVDETRGVAFVQDISDRKHAEGILLEAQQQAISQASKLQVAKARLRAILEAAPVGIGMCDVNGKIIEVNKGNRILWGEELPYSESVDAYREWKGWWADGSTRHGRRIEPEEWAMARALAGEDAPRDLIEIEPFDSPGTRKTVLNCGSPVRNDVGQIVGAVVAQMDISDWVRTENALRESELKFRTITDAMPQIVFSSLPDGYNDYQNKHLYDYTGAVPGSLEGEAWLKVVHPDDVAACMRRWTHSLTTGEAYEIRYRIRHKSGEYRWALGRALPIKNAEGNVIRWLGTCTDIHEEVLIQEALEDADRRKDDFIALLAHELRNPLAPVRTALDMFRLRPPADEILKRAVVIMDRQVKQMSSLIDDLLDVARITKGKVSLKLQQCDLSNILQAVCDDHKGPMAESGITLEIDLPSTPVMLEGDNVRLTQIFGNLLHNACKYSKHGGTVRVKAWLSNTNVEKLVVISIQDNGLGMSKELLSRLFKPFTQAEERSDTINGGLGLGLAIVKGLVELHKGTISAASSGLGLGSTFTVTLPISVVRETTSMATEDMTTASTPKKILMIDDNEDFSFAMSSALSSFGHDLVIAHTGKSGLETYDLFRPDVVICDIGLPDITGYDVARAITASITENTKPVFLIALSGYGQESDKKLAQEAGFQVHLTKPVDLENLLKLL